MSSRSISKRATIVLMMFGIFIVVNIAMVAYGLAWTWMKSTGYIEQNTAGIKPQEGPGPRDMKWADLPYTGAIQAAAAPGTAGSPVQTAAVPMGGPETRLGIKNDAHTVINPVKPGAASLFRGKQIFDTSCSPCHGLDGAGHGIMGTVPRLSQAPASEVKELQTYLSAFTSDVPDIDPSFALKLTDGELYWIITNGGEAIMPGYADAISPDARWDLINYIKYGLGEKRGL